jgi:hypothetical protein
MNTTWWPLSLPQCKVRGTQRTPLPNVVAFGTEVGPGKVRRRSTARVMRVTASAVLTAAQAEIFETFFQRDLQDGALTFTMNDPTDGATATWRFDAQSPYTLTEQGTRHVLAMNLSRLP